MKICLISTEKSVHVMALRMLSSLLKKEGHDVTLLFLNYCPPRLPESILQELLEKCQYMDMLGISCTKDNSDKAIQVAGCLKKLNKPIVWGGYFATLYPDVCIDYVDIVCIGEAEKTFIELVRRIEKAESITDIPGLWVKKINKIFRNKPSIPVRDLDDVPVPDFSLEKNYIIENDKIVEMVKDHMDIFNIGSRDPYSMKTSMPCQTSRGCNYSCTYCSIPCFSKITNAKGVRTMSPQKVISHIKSVISNHDSFDFICFSDEDITSRKIDYLETLCRLYKKEIDLPFSCYIDPRSFNREKIDLLFDSGLASIKMGIQTGSDKVNKEIFHRNTSREMILRVANYINKRLECPPTFHFIIRNPFESEDDILQTFILMKELPKPFIASFYDLIFYKTTEIYKKALKEGIIDSKGNYSSNFSFGKRETILNDIISKANGFCDEYYYSAIRAETINKIAGEKMETEELSDISSSLEKRILVFKTYDGDLMLRLDEHDRLELFNTIREFQKEHRLFVDTFSNNIILRFELPDKEKSQVQWEFIESLNSLLIQRKLSSD